MNLKPDVPWEGQSYPFLVAPYMGEDFDPYYSAYGTYEGYPPYAPHGYYPPDYNQKKFKNAGKYPNYN